MKKIDYSFITSSAAQPFKQGTLKHLQDAYIEALYGVTQGLINNTSGLTILNGCVNSTPVGATYTISPGTVYYQGEIYIVDAVTLVVVGAPIPVMNVVTTYYTDPSADPVTFTDSVTHNVHEIRKVVISLALTGTGIVDYVNAYNDRWHTIGSSFGSVTEPAFTNGYTAGTQAPRFKLGKDGFIRFSGVLTPGTSGAAAWTLPATVLNFRPATAKGFPVFTDAGLGIITVQTNGQVIPTFPGGATYITLDGINFPIV